MIIGCPDRVSVVSFRRRGRLRTLLRLSFFPPTLSTSGTASALQWNGPQPTWGTSTTPDATGGTGLPPRKRLRSMPGPSGAPVNPTVSQAADVATGATVQTSKGQHAIAAPKIAAPDLPVPPGCTRPAIVSALLSVAALLLVPVASSVTKIRGACDRFKRAVTWMGLSLASVTPPIILAYIILRCAPPIDTTLPDGWTIVSPVTAAGDIDCLRRAARLGLEGMEAILEALLSPVVSALLVGVGGRIKRLKTSKSPVLYSEVAASFAAAAANPTEIAVRDAFALVLGLHFALRASELLSLLGSDITVVDGGKALQIRFRNVKNRQSVFTTHDPFIVTAGGDLLMRAFQLFSDRVGFRDDLQIFHNLRRGVNYERPLSRDWLSNVVAAAAPDRTQHSLRVGAATEYYAAGVELADIMAIGRWTSSVALLYVLGTMEDTLTASRSMGSAGLRITKEGLRRAARTSIPADAIPRADAARWKDACMRP